MIDTPTCRMLVRYFYFSEALAIYELYYRPIVSSSTKAQRELTDPGRSEDRPPTWVPLVFHCTTADCMESIISDGMLKPSSRGYVSFTELPIGELDRMKFRKHGAAQVAIGFPRRFIESLGLAPVWYLKHNTAAARALARLRTADPSAYQVLAPFIEETDDVSSFQEVRTTSGVPISDAVWMLSTERENGYPVIPHVAEFQARYGRIPTSFWHRSHQLGILDEAQFTTPASELSGAPEKFRMVGEHYWKLETRQPSELTIRLPVHDADVVFDVADVPRHRQFEGPWRFIDIARMLAQHLTESGEQIDSILSHRAIKDITSRSK